MKELNFQGYEVILVTSGAVGVGRQRLKYRKLINSRLAPSRLVVTIFDVKWHLSFADNSPWNYSFADLQNPQLDMDGKACAAVGQSGLMAIYDTLFSQVRFAINIYAAVLFFSC